MTVAERRAREKGERRVLILSCARKLFEENGLKATTVEQIADHAELGKGTIYNYFPCKEDIYFQLLIDSLDVLRESLEWALALGSDGELVSRTLEAFDRFHRDRRGLNEIMLFAVDENVARISQPMLDDYDALLHTVMQLLEDLSAALALDMGQELENPRDVGLFLLAVEIGVTALIRMGREFFPEQIDEGRMWNTAREMLLDGIENRSRPAC
ncbi:MAG: TetR/AcrR family transcriptional regulator [Actinobacteria bacterium]|nr:TetR/AcrR family transcriptional regulator [Actinomycetota bacterium]MBU1944048.1 TetR/AcrR family transcriptional regulator [Actinomycetota bacterium]MBU2688543.1 TetR/AcrR family transcriptional regulator [Actinomycetota bacterium]